MIMMIMMMIMIVLIIWKVQSIIAYGDKLY